MTTGDEVADADAVAAGAEPVAADVAGAERVGVDPPAVVLIGGLPGSGKSTIGRVLAARLGAALLDLDTLTNPLLARIAESVGAGDNLDHPALRGEIRAARYQCLRDTVAEVVRGGCPVVAVAPFTAELTDPVAWQAFSAGLGVDRPVLVQTVVDPVVALTRRARRGLPRDGDFVPPTAVDSTTATTRADGAADVEVEVARIARLVHSGELG